MYALVESDIYSIYSFNGSFYAKISQHKTEVKFVLFSRIVTNI